MILRTKVLAAAASLALCAAALPAVAASTVYTFNSTAVGAFGSGPYGSVSLTEVGSGVSFSVGLRDDLNFVTTGNTNSKAVFAFNATGVSVGDITNIVDASGQTFSVVAPGNDSPFGTFTFGIVCATKCSNGGSAGGYSDPLTFTVANATLGDFALKSSGGTAAYFAADVIQGSSGATGAIGVTNASVAAIPEPETYALMLAGLGALGFVSKRRQSR